MSSKIAKNINVPLIWEVCLKMLLVCVVILSGFARFLLPAYEYVSSIIPGKHNLRVGLLQHIWTNVHENMARSDLRMCKIWKAGGFSEPCRHAIRLRVEDVQNGWSLMDTLTKETRNRNWWSVRPSFYSRQRKKQSVGEEIVGKRKEQDKTSYIG